MPRISPRPKTRRVEAILFREARVVLDHDRGHVVLLFSTGKTEHSFALPAADASTLAAEIQRVLAEAEDN